MKVSMALAILGVTLLAGPAIQPGQSLHAQASKPPKEQPKQQPSSGGRAAPPRQDPPPAPPRQQPPAAQQPKPPQSTGEPELKRRKP